MLEKICQYLKNYFCVGACYADFTIENGLISATNAIGDLNIDDLQEGQYIRIIGSVFNDGVYRYPTSAEDLQDEVFDGALWAMAVPKKLISLSTEIEAWIAANAESLNSPYQSESFGGYSYTKASGNGSDGGSAYGWQEQFASELAPYKKMRVDARRGL